MKAHLTTDQLRDPAVMLETLKMAYRDLLDSVPYPDGTRRPQSERRLTVEEQRELGYRLASYWMVSPETNPPPTAWLAHTLDGL